MKLSCFVFAYCNHFQLHLSKWVYPCMIRVGEENWVEIHFKHYSERRRYIVDMSRKLQKAEMSMHSNWMIWFPVFSPCSSSCNKECIMNGRYDIFEKRKKLYDEKIYILCSKNEIWREILFNSGGVRTRCKNTARWYYIHLSILILS